MAKKGRLGRFISNIYAPLLVNKAVKALVVCGYLALLVRDIFFKRENYCLYLSHGCAASHPFHRDGDREKHVSCSEKSQHTNTWGNQSVYVISWKEKQHPI